MKIAAVQTAEISGHGWNCLVRVRTDEGLDGYGECVHGGPGVQSNIAAMGELLAGEDPLNVERLFERLRRRYLFDGALGGHAVTAMVGIEIALWDLAGRALGLPVWRLLGSRYRDRVAVYADCHAGAEDTPQSYAEKAREVVGLGYSAIKFDVDDPHHPKRRDAWNWSATNAELEDMVARVAAVREAVGPHVDIAIDMHGRYNQHSAAAFCREVAPFNLLWVEDPVPPENVDALREVKRRSPVPICTGENLYMRHGFRSLLESQAADIIMPDLPKCCGLAEAKIIAAMADLYYVPLAPHNVSGPIGTVASAHLCAAVPNFLLLEWHWLERPHWHELTVGETPVIENGAVSLGDAPGLGVELDLEAVRRHLRPGTLLFGEAP